MKILKKVTFSLKIVYNISMMKKILKRKLDAFMGRTHCLLSLCCLFAFMLIPLEFFEMTFWKLKENWLLALVAIIVLCGGALFPDLDADMSKAAATLGPLGVIFKTFMKSTSLIVWNLYHFKGDRKPDNQHRYLWHAPLIWVGLGILLYVGLNGGEYGIFTNIINSFKTDSFLYFLRKNAILVLFILLMFMSVLIGSSMVLDVSVKVLGKSLSIPKSLKYIIPVLVLIYIFSTSYSNLRILGICFAAGAVLHCLEDGFADTGLPSLIFPIPQFWRNKVWGRIKLFPVTVTTNSTMNTIIDFVAAATMIILGILAFKR